MASCTTLVFDDPYGSIAYGVPYLHSLVATGRTPLIEGSAAHAEGVAKMLDLLFDRHYMPAPLKNTSMPQPVPQKGCDNPQLALALQFAWSDYFDSQFYDENQCDPCAVLYVACDHLVSHIRQTANGAGLCNYLTSSSFDHHYEDGVEQVIFKVTIVFDSVLDRVNFEKIVAH